jgi:hypothetical protein
MLSPDPTIADPILKILEKDIHECIHKFEKTHGLIVEYVKFELLKQQTDEGSTDRINFEATVDIIV